MHLSNIFKNTFYLEINQNNFLWPETEFLFFSYYCPIHAIYFPD